MARRGSRARADIAVVGSGPNGLTAAALLACAGLQVDVYEAKDTPGGGTRTEELLESGHWHDLCSAVHPMAFVSPAFAQLGLTKALEWAVPEISYAHPLDGGRAGLAYRDFEATVRAAGADGPSYRRLMGPLVAASAEIVETAFNPVLPLPASLPGALTLGLAVAWQAGPWWNAGFRTAEVPALLTGALAHASARLPSPSAAATGLVLGALAHGTGWPIPMGGSARISDYLLEQVQTHGGRLHLGTRVRDLGDVEANVILCDTTPAGLLEFAGRQLPEGYRRQMEAFHYKGAACKVDFILSEPIPWANPALTRAGTVHIGGTRAQVADAESRVAAGQHPERPYTLLSQPSSFDPSRAPAGRHIIWSYAHVPAGSERDMTEAVTGQIERFAPGFRDTIVRSGVIPAARLAAYNPNYIGGDFAAGATTLPQILARPRLSLRGTPWKTPLPHVYLCSASTTPGPGVHGMAGYHAARLALKEHFRELLLPTTSQQDPTDAHYYRQGSFPPTDPPERP